MGGGGGARLGHWVVSYTGMSADNIKGLLLAVSSSLFIGASFIVKKKGLKKAGASGVRAGTLTRPPATSLLSLPPSALLCPRFALAKRAALRPFSCWPPPPRRVAGPRSAREPREIWISLAAAAAGPGRWIRMTLEHIGDRDGC
jgi:hypothetical protein